MKRFAWLLFLVTLVARGQNTLTPNIGMEIPPYGSNNWNIPLNYNFTQLDLLLSGNATLPGLSVTGYALMPGLTTWKSSFPYAIGNVVFYQGVAYTSLVAGNQGNTPTQGSFWSATINGGGGSIPDTTLVLKGNNVGGAVAATLNVDYLSPTYWAGLSGCTTAGYSYIPASNTCLLAGGGANTPATSLLLKGGGVANSVVPGVPGTDYLLPTAIPRTTLLLEGTGLAGSMQPANPGTDYVIPSGSITGSAGSLSAASSLPNGTNAVTQSVGDSSNDVATDAFVLANAGGGGGAAFPATNGLVKNTSTTASVTAVAGTDYMAGVTASVYGQAPISTAAGGTYTAQAVPLSFGSYYNQYIQQQTNNANYTTLGINNLNSVFNVDGFSGGAYTGLGLAEVAWTSGPDKGLCQVVSYTGNNWIAISPGNGTTAPGSNLAIWWPVPGTQPSTNWDCANATAAAYGVARSLQTEVDLGSNYYYMNGFIMPGGLYSVSEVGCGIFCTYGVYSGSTGTPMFYRPTGGNYAQLQIRDMILDGGGLASAIMNLGAMNQSVIANMEWLNIAPGQDHFAEFGLSPGDAFQLHASNLTWTGGTASVPAATVTANVVGGAVTSYTVTNGGSAYIPPSATNVYHVALLGYKGGTAAKPCTVMPTGMTVTVSGGAITAVTPSGSNGSGCSGTIDVQVYASFPVNWGIVDNASDSTMDDIIGYSGDLGILQINAGNGVFHHIHPSVNPMGISVNGSASFFGTECDSVYQYCFTLNQPYATQATSIVGTQGYLGGAPRRAPGSSPFLLTSTSTNVNFSTMASLCDDATGSGQLTDWHEFVTPTGPIDAPGDYLTKAPTGMTVLGNDTTCNEVNGDYTATFTTKTSGGGPTLGANTFTGTQSAPAFTLLPLGTAISGTNYSSGALNVTGSYFNVSALADNWAVSNVVGSGTAPASALTIYHTGSAGTASVYLPNSNLIVGAISSTAFSTFNVGFGANAGNSYIGGTLALSLGTAIASASTIAPTALVTHITGSATVNTITVPASCQPSASWACLITLISDGGFSTGTSGNIAVALTTTAGNTYQFYEDPNTSKWYPIGGGSGGGSGTVSSGTAWSPTFYGATGSTVSGTTPFTGLEYFPGSAAPQAATPTNMLSLVGYYTGTYSGSATYKFNDTASDGSGNNYISLSAGNVGNALTNPTYWHFLGGVSTTITGGNCTSANQFVTSISTTGVPTCSGLGVALTSATTITSTSFVTTGLALPSIPVSSTVRGHCSIIWEQSTATNTVQFGAGNSSTPTNLYTMSTLHSGASGGTSTDQYTAITSTTTTAISATGAPGATATGYKEEIDLTLVNSATGADVVTIYALTGSGSDAVVIEPGSSCEWLP